MLKKKLKELAPNTYFMHKDNLLFKLDKKNIRPEVLRNYSKCDVVLQIAGETFGGGAVFPMHKDREVCIMDYLNSKDCHFDWEEWAESGEPVLKEIEIGELFVLSGYGLGMAIHQDRIVGIKNWKLVFLFGREEAEDGGKGPRIEYFGPDSPAQPVDFELTIFPW